MKTIENLELALSQADALSDSLRVLSINSSNKEDEEVYLHWLHEVTDLVAELEESLSERVEW